MADQTRFIKTMNGLANRKLGGFMKFFRCEKAEELDRKNMTIEEEWVQLTSNKIIDLIPEAVFYWYQYGCYEGCGALIAVINNKYYLKDLGHCSCYEPLDDFANDISEYKFNNLDEICKAGTEDWNRAYEPLVELAKKLGYK
jgi:hypothetical protein